VICVQNEVAVLKRKLNAMSGAVVFKSFRRETKVFTQKDGRETEQQLPKFRIQ